jgi:hypothetical protein
VDLELEPATSSVSPLPRGEVGSRSDPGEGIWPIDRGSTGMIPDILDRQDSRQFGLSGVFTRFAEPLATRSEPGEQTAAIDQTDVHLAKAHDVVAGLEFCNADKFVHQRLADGNELAFPFDFAVAADARTW